MRESDLNYAQRLDLAVRRIGFVCWFSFGAFIGHLTGDPFALGVSCLFMVGFMVVWEVASLASWRKEA